MHHSLVRASKVFTVTIPRFTVTREARAAAGRAHARRRPSEQEAGAAVGIAASTGTSCGRRWENEERETYVSPLSIEDWEDVIGD